MSRICSMALLAVLCGFVAGLAAAEKHCAPQPDGSEFCLDRPAERIVALAPHLTEMVFAVGAEQALHAVVSHSDYPEAARNLPVIGGYRGLDFEAILRLQPDLVLAWGNGNPATQIDRLRQLGLPVWITPGRQFEDVPTTLRHLGRLTDRQDQADRIAANFEGKVRRLTEQHRDRPRLKGFFEIWPAPLITVGPDHFISEAMQRCSIDNIVERGLGDTPTWSEEAVLRAGPDLIITSPPARDFDRWKRWQQLPAVRHDGLIVMPPDILMRVGPRLADALETLCAEADRVRAKLWQAQDPPP